MTHDIKLSTTHDASQDTSDAYGRAALLLVESLIHQLCENAMLNADDSLSVAERAADIQDERAKDSQKDRASMFRSHALLAAIVTSLRAEVGCDATP